MFAIVMGRFDQRTGQGGCGRRVSWFVVRVTRLGTIHFEGKPTFLRIIYAILLNTSDALDSQNHFLCAP